MAHVLRRPRMLCRFGFIYAGTTAGCASRFLQYASYRWKTVRTGHTTKRRVASVIRHWLNLLTLLGRTAAGAGSVKFARLR